MTFVYKDMFTCVSFRGTDTSTIGWREDFNMAFTMPAPPHRTLRWSTSKPSPTRRTYPKGSLRRRSLQGR